MLGRTKAANKSVLDEASNSLNTGKTSAGDEPFFYPTACYISLLIF